MICLKILGILRYFLEKSFLYHNKIGNKNDIAQNTKLFGRKKIKSRKNTVYFMLYDRSNCFIFTSLSL